MWIFDLFSLTPTVQSTKAPQQPSLNGAQNMASNTQTKASSRKSGSTRLPKGGRPLPPHAARVLKHLEHRGSISPMEALASYSNTRLAASVHVLRNNGYRIATNMRSDEAGHKYARYTFNNAQ